jgi:hypothetical protein
MHARKFFLTSALITGLMLTSAAHADGARIRTGRAQVVSPANTSSVIQAGSGNAAGIAQTGASNTAGIRQFGASNTGAITQDGTGNTACLVQSGRNLNGSIQQTGNNQNTGILQTRNKTISIPASACETLTSRGDIMFYTGQGKALGQVRRY